MAQETDESGIFIVVHDPSQSARQRELQHASVLSYTITKSYKRRQTLTLARIPRNRGRNSKLLRAQLIRQPGHTEASSPLRWNYCSPFYMANQGNSDPFNSTPVVVTPEISEVLSMWHNHMQSDTTTATIWLAKANLEQDLLSKDELSIRSVLFTCLAHVSSQSFRHRDLRIRRLQQKAECLKQLQNSIDTQLEEIDRVIFIKSLCLILIGSVMSDEWDEAKIHGKQLMKELAVSNSAQLWTGELERNFVISRVHYVENKCALVYMHPPVLDVKYLTKEWASHLAPIHEWLQCNPSVLRILQYPEVSIALQDIFRRLQEHVDVQCEGIPLLSGHARDYRILSSPMIYPMQLTNLLFNYLGSSEQQHLAQVEIGDRNSQKAWQVEILLTLAVIAFMACERHGPAIFELRKRGERAMGKLRGFLERNEHFQTRHSLPTFHQHSHLWALYIGSIWEVESQLDAYGSGWFVCQLRQKVENLNIRSWDDFKQITDNFVRVEPQGWHLTVWFPGMDQRVWQSDPVSTDNQVYKPQANPLASLLFDRNLSAM